MTGLRQDNMTEIKRSPLRTARSARPRVERQAPRRSDLRAVACAVTLDLEGAVIEIGSGRLASVREVAELVTVITGGPPPELGVLLDRPNDPDNAAKRWRVDRSGVARAYVALEATDPRSLYAGQPRSAHRDGLTAFVLQTGCPAWHRHGLPWMSATAFSMDSSMVRRI
jgi:nucleoside-diphosphate-sugar epimerase